MGGGPWQGIFLQTGTKSKVNEASQKRSLEFVLNQTRTIKAGSFERLLKYPFRLT